MPTTLTLGATVLRSWPGFQISIVNLMSSEPTILFTLDLKVVSHPASSFADLHPVPWQRSLNVVVSTQRDIVLTSPHARDKSDGKMLLSPLHYLGEGRQWLLVCFHRHYLLEYLLSLSPPFLL